MIYGQLERSIQTLECTHLPAALGFSNKHSGLKSVIKLATKRCCLGSSVPFNLWKFAMGRFSSEEEYAACRKRHHRYVMSVAKELSVLFEGTDFEKLKETSPKLFSASPMSANLYLPRYSRVALDTNLLIYLAQMGMAQVQSKSERVAEILASPLELVLCDSVFMECMSCLIRNKVSLPGIDVADGWNDDVRKERLRVVGKLFQMLSFHAYAQSERGRSSYLNVFRLISDRNIQPYDARIATESADPGVLVYLTEDYNHGESLPCCKGGVVRSVRVWNPFTHGLIITPGILAGKPSP